MNEYVGTALLLGLGIVVTYYQAKWYEYDPDKDFQMEPEDIQIRNLSSQFQYEKMAREIDECDDVETLQQMCKFLVKSEMKTREMFSIIIQDTMPEINDSKK